MNQLFLGLAYHSTSNACLVDIAPPTFAGITAVTPNSDGSFTSAWGAATEGTLPLLFEIYILPGSVSAATLFAATPADFARSSPRRTYLDSNGNPMLKDQLYTLGVRVRDAVGNLNTNIAILTATAIGSVNLAQVLQDVQTALTAAAVDLDNTATDFAATEALLAQDQINLHNDISQIDSLLVESIVGVLDETEDDTALSGVIEGE